jgi:hypothetical protein
MSEKPIKETRAEHLAKVAAVVTPRTIAHEPATEFDRWQAEKMARHTTTAEQRGPGRGGPRHPGGR